MKYNQKYRVITLRQTEKKKSQIKLKIKIIQKGTVE